MIKIEDFRDAPIGATATRTDGGRAMKMNDGVRGWITPKDGYFSDKEMVHWGYVLDLPTSAREALDCAWELAHEVKPGQVIPADTRFLEVTGIGLGERVGRFDLKIDPSHVKTIRTFDPLPDPEPDWIDAPAVLAHTDNDDTRRVWTAHRDERWASTGHTYTRLWQNLRDVTPLYPQGTKEKKNEQD